MIYYKCNKGIIMAKVLLLNTKNEPLKVCTWKRALVLIIKGKAKCALAIENLEDMINVQNILIPRIIKLNYEVAVPDLELPFSRENIFIRDNYTCQYCGEKFSADELTLDHVYPKSRFGPDMWENIVTCCKHCNQYKADRTPKEAGMKLLRRPYRPQEAFDFEMKKYSYNDTYYWQQYFQAS